MRTIMVEKTLYQFHELPEDAKQYAISTYWGEDWDYESVFYDAKQIGKCMGIDIDDIYFRGFWSQGDGACFTGHYRYAKAGVKAVMEYAPQDKELHRIAKELQDVQKKYFYKLHTTITQSGMYCHEGTMRFETIHMDGDMNRYDCRGPSDDDENDIKEALRDFARWIYKQLEEQYGYETSEEAVLEACEANGYEFDDKGRIL